MFLLSIIDIDAGTCITPQHSSLPTAACPSLNPFRHLAFLISCCCTLSSLPCCITPSRIIIAASPPLIPFLQLPFLFFVPVRHPLLLHVLTSLYSCSSPSYPLFQFALLTPLLLHVLTSLLLHAIPISSCGTAFPLPSVHPPHSPRVAPTCGVATRDSQPCIRGAMPVVNNIGLAGGPNPGGASRCVYISFSVLSPRYSGNANAVFSPVYAEKVRK